MDNEHYYNLQTEKIQNALDNLLFGNLERVEIYQNVEVILRYPQGNVWLSESSIAFSTPVKGMMIELNANEIKAIAYLHEMRASSIFIPTIEAWNGKRKKLEEKQDYIDKLRLIQNEVSYLYDKIEDIIKKEVKESL